MGDRRSREGAQSVEHDEDGNLELGQLTREELIDLVEQQRERGIRLSFSGKANARGLARRVRPRTLRQLKKYGAGPEEQRANNLVIEGDNLQAMATLYRLRGQVDLVLADPPYNTGNDFRYNDRWEDDPNDPGLGEFISPDDGARHTKWMRFMYPRLQLMRAMLKPGGVLAICVDHRELFHLGQLLDELFREENRLAIINWQKTYAPKSHEGHVSTATEYVLVYTKNVEKAHTGLLPREASTDAKYRNMDNDPNGLWRVDNATAMGASSHPGQVYGIQNPFSGEVQYPPEGRCWSAERAKMLRWLEEWGGTYESRMLPDGAPSPALVLAGVPLPTPHQHPVLVAARHAAEQVRENKVWPQLWFGRDGYGRPNRKRYLSQVKQGMVPTTYWSDEDYEVPDELGSVAWDHEQSGHSQSGQRELRDVLGPGRSFETVKPLKLFRKIIQIWCPPSGLVLDPFAGSGTTGHAVLELNHATGAARRFALIEQGRPERGDSYARSLLSDRLQRVVSGRWKVGSQEPTGGGFGFSALDRRVDAPVLLSMERADMTDTVIASHFDATRRRGVGLCRLPVDDYRYLVAKNTDEEGFFLVWGGPDGNTDFNEDVYEAIAEEADQAGLKPLYHVYARLYLFQSNTVIFYQIPDRILRDFGLDLRGEPFSDD